MMISIVTPTFNEIENIKDLIFAVKKEMIDNKLIYEHIIIDNNSKDGTKELLKSIATADKNLKVIINKSNYGHLKSPYYAMLQSSGEATILLNADFQDPPSLLIKLIEKWKNGSELVLLRKSDSNEGFLMKLLRKTFYFLLNRISETDLPRNTTGSGLYSKKIVSTLREIKDPCPYLRGLVIELGYQADFVDFVQPLRKAGITKNNFYSLIDVALLGVVKHSKIPLRIMTILGLFSGLIFFLISIFFLFYKIIAWNSFQLGLAPIIIGLFGIGSLQILFLGLIGEYLHSVLSYNKNLPLVIEQERINF